MEVTRKQSTPNFPQNEHLIPPDTHTYVCLSGVKNVPFSENLACFVFLVTSVLSSIFLQVAVNEFKEKNALRYHLLRNHGSVLWNNLPNEIRNLDLSEFIAKIKKWKPDSCKCRICKPYVGSVGLIKRKYYLENDLISL